MHAGRSDAPRPICEGKEGGQGQHCQRGEATSHFSPDFQLDLQSALTPASGDILQLLLRDGFSMGSSAMFCLGAQVNASCMEGYISALGRRVMRSRGARHWASLSSLGPMCLWRCAPLPLLSTAKQLWGFFLDMHCRDQI